MTGDKFDVARAGLAEFERTQRASDFFADDFVWDFSEWEGWIEAPEYHGHAGFDEQMARWTEPFESWSWELSELIDAGGDEILAVGVQRGILKGSNAAVVMPVAQIWTVRDGKLRRARMFLEPVHAYRAAGLPAPTGQSSAEPQSARASQRG
jgi:ketosteroid isomerase-like protein